MLSLNAILEKVYGGKNHHIKIKHDNKCLFWTSDTWAGLNGHQSRTPFSCESDWATKERLQKTSNETIQIKPSERNHGYVAYNANVTRLAPGKKRYAGWWCEGRRQLLNNIWWYADIHVMKRNARRYQKLLSDYRTFASIPLFLIYKMPWLWVRCGEIDYIPQIDRFDHYAL